MKKTEEQWRSPSLGKQMNVTVYGDSGTPLIAFPTRGQHSGQWEKYGMIDAISYQLKNGYNQLFCVETVDQESILNRGLDPRKRLMRHEQYEDYIIEELIPFIRDYNSVQYLMVAGLDLGGYHAMNFALKYPKIFDKVIGISGIYDIRDFFGDFYNDALYYNNPIDFAPNISKPDLIGAISKIDFRLVSFKDDHRKKYADTLAEIFHMQSIEYQLDIWDLPAGNEWNYWQKMLQTHII